MRRVAEASSIALVALAALGCGESRAGTGAAFPATRWAERDSSTEQGTECAYSTRYDPKRGCALDAWGIPLTVRLRNEISRAFVLVGAAFALDGVLAFDANDPDLLGQQSFPVLTTGLTHGSHELATRLVYRGNGYGVFAYLRSYRFRMQAAKSFEARPGAGLTIVVHGYEKGGLTTPIEQRPALRFELEPDEASSRAR